MTYLFIVLIKYQINNYPQHPTDSMKGQQAITLRAALPQRGLIGVLAPFHYASVTLRDAERPAILMAGALSRKESMPRHNKAEPPKIVLKKIK